MKAVTQEEIERIRQVLREVFCRDVDVQPRETAACFNCYHVADLGDNVSAYYFPGTRNLMIEERSRGIHRVYINIDDTRETRCETLFTTPCGVRRVPF